ncbi:hypothetical protein ACQUY5_25065 [Bacillus cereus]|uniref:hypothetical protein n=1 Tax=Bacillus cereus TaxID=1396 RepID=UPI003D180EE8
MSNKENSYLILVTGLTDVKKLEEDYNDISIKDSILQDKVHFQRKDVEVNWNYMKKVTEDITTYTQSEEYKTVSRVCTKLIQSVSSNVVHITFGLRLVEQGYTGSLSSFKEVVNFIIEKEITLHTEIPLEGGDGIEKVTVTSKQLKKHIDYIRLDAEKRESLKYITELSGYKLQEENLTNAPKLLSLPINYKTKDYINFEDDKTLISFKLSTESPTDVFLNKLLTLVNNSMGAEVVDLQMSRDIISEIQTMYFNILCDVNAEEDIIRLVLNLSNESINQRYSYDTTGISINIEREVDKGVTSNTNYYFLMGEDDEDGIGLYKEHLTQSSADIFGYKTFF